MRSAQKCNAALGLLAAVAASDYFLPFSRKAKGPSGPLSPSNKMVRGPSVLASDLDSMHCRDRRKVEEEGWLP